MKMDLVLYLKMANQLTISYSTCYQEIKIGKELILSYNDSFQEVKFGLSGFIPMATVFLSKLKFLTSFIEPLKVFSFILSVIGIFSLDKYWKKVLLLTILTIVMPNPSFVYTCLNLFFPVILFLNEKEHTMSDWKYLFLIILILSPFQYAGLNGFVLTIIYVNMSVLFVQLLLCIEGVKACYQKFVKQPKIQKITCENNIL